METTAGITLLDELRDGDVAAEHGGAGRRRCSRGWSRCAVAVVVVVGEGGDAGTDAPPMRAATRATGSQARDVCRPCASCRSPAPAEGAAVGERGRSATGRRRRRTARGRPGAAGRRWRVGRAGGAVGRRPGGGVGCAAGRRWRGWRRDGGRRVAGPAGVDRGPPVVAVPGAGGSRAGGWPPGVAEASGRRQRARARAARCPRSCRSSWGARGPSAPLPVGASPVPAAPALSRTSGPCYGTPLGDPGIGAARGRGRGSVSAACHAASTSN